MAQWWEDFISNPLGGVQSWLGGLAGASAPGQMVNREQSWASQRYGVNGAADRRATPQERAIAQTGAGAVAPINPAINGATLIPSNLETAGRMGGANAPLGLTSAPMPPSYFGMSPEELMQYLLGGGGGGPAPLDLSGYDPLLEDIASREAALGARKAEQQAYLTSLFDAAEARATADREALAAAVDAQLASDQARRAEEIALIRNDEAGRLAMADAARGALGVAPGPDLSSEIAQNAVGGVGAAGSVAERDARIRQSLGEQQFGRELSGLTPMEGRFISDLSRGYEDRLGALASERANIMAQIAAAKAAPRGGGGPSVNDRLNVLEFVQNAFGPGEAAALPGVAGFLQQSGVNVPPGLFPDLVAIGDRVLRTTAGSSFLPGEPAGAQEILSNLAQTDPAIDSLLKTYPGAAAIILDYVNQAS